MNININNKQIRYNYDAGIISLDTVIDLVVNEIVQDQKAIGTCDVFIQQSTSLKRVTSININTNINTGTNRTEIFSLFSNSIDIDYPYTGPLIVTLKVDLLVGDKKITSQKSFKTAPMHKIDNIKINTENIEVSPNANILLKIMSNTLSNKASENEGKVEIKYFVNDNDFSYLVEAINENTQKDITIRLPDEDFFNKIATQRKDILEIRIVANIRNTETLTPEFLSSSFTKEFYLQTKKGKLATAKLLNNPETPFFNEKVPLGGVAKVELSNLEKRITEDTPLKATLFGIGNERKSIGIRLNTKETTVDKTIIDLGPFFLPMENKTINIEIGSQVAILDNVTVLKYPQIKITNFNIKSTKIQNGKKIEIRYLINSDVDEKQKGEVRINILDADKNSIIKNDILTNVEYNVLQTYSFNLYNKDCNMKVQMEVVDKTFSENNSIISYTNTYTYNDKVYIQLDKEKNIYSFGGIEEKDNTFHIGTDYLKLNQSYFKLNDIDLLNKINENSLVNKKIDGIDITNLIIYLFGLPVPIEEINKILKDLQDSTQITSEVRKALESLHIY